jgi:eukaryotic-like serine/threonine-protein kinase
MDSFRPSALPDWSAVPGDSEDDRLFLNHRLAFFGAVLFSLSGAFVLLNVVIALVLNEPWMRFDRCLHVGATMMFGTEWLLCRRGRRSAAQLNVIDTGTVLAGLCMFAWMAASQPRPVDPNARRAVAFIVPLVLTLITLSTVVTRAVIVPGTARRTFWLSTVACLPGLVAASSIVAAAPPATEGPGRPALSLITVAMWSMVAVSIATLAARVIYGLSQRVRKANELGQYTLEEKIGAGGMGTVYRARHALLRRPTAVKLLPPELAGERSIQRFEREVQLTSALTHPNTIAVYDYGRTPDGIFYYAMEYLEGITLEELVTHDGPQPAARVVHLLKQLCGALREAHGIQLIHRDVKPANIVLCVRGGVADYVKVLDFGLVKQAGASAPGLSTADAVVGTPKYMAPEAITNPDGIDARADLYGVGGVAYELLSAVPPFDGATVVEVCSKILYEAPAPLSERGVSVPRALETLVFACLAKDPTERPDSAAAILDRLESQPEVGVWSERDATRWWQERGPAVLAAARARRSAGITHSDRRTLTVHALDRT